MNPRPTYDDLVRALIDAGAYRKDHTEYPEDASGRVAYVHPGYTVQRCIRCGEAFLVAMTRARETLRCENNDCGKEKEYA